jgi:hypothetical protein
MFGTGAGQSYPFRRAEPPGLSSQRYEPGALPCTDDVLSRSVALTVGLSDTYTGAHFGVNVFSGPEEVRAVAEKFNATMDEVLG